MVGDVHGPKDTLALWAWGSQTSDAPWRLDGQQGGPGYTGGMTEPVADSPVSLVVVSDFV